MRALLIDRLPNISVAHKKDADRPLNGVKVTDASLVQALLNHGTYDVYYYIRESSENCNADEYENAGRLHALDLGSLESMRQKSPEELLLFTSSHQIAKFVPFRQFCGHDEWPICGRTHGLSASSLIPSYAWNYFAELQEHDAIICTSTAGKRALNSIFEGLHRSRSVAGTRKPFAVRTPLLYIDGVEIGSTPTLAQRNNSGLVVLSIGRFSASHKADLRPLIAAFLSGPGLPVCATLILAGDDTQGHIAGELEAFARSFASSRKVVVMPNVSAATKKSLLAVADVALCLSDTCQETFGLSVLEAMAAGLPVVAPDWDGYRDIVLHNKTGFLVPTAMLPDTGLLNAVSLLIDPAFAMGQRVMVDLEQAMHWVGVLGRNGSLAVQMGHNGRELARNQFSWPAVVCRLEDCWNKQFLLSRKIPPHASPGPFGFMDYDPVFQYHPSRWLAPNTIVTLHKHAEESVYRTFTGAFLSPSPLAGFSGDLPGRIVDVCRTRGPLTVAELTQQLQSDIAGPSIVTTQISRLAKYGLLRMQPNTFHASLQKENYDEADTVSALSSLSV